MGIIGLTITGKDNVRMLAEKLGLEFKGEPPPLIRFGIHPEEVSHFLYRGEPPIVRDTADNGIEISIEEEEEEQKRLPVIGSVAYYVPGEFLQLQIYSIVKDGTDIGLLPSRLYVALWEGQTGAFRVVDVPAGENYFSLQDTKMAEEIKEVLRVYVASGKDCDVLNSSWLGFSDRVVDFLHTYWSSSLDSSHSRGSPSFSARSIRSSIFSGSGSIHLDVPQSPIGMIR